MNWLDILYTEKNLQDLLKRLEEESLSGIWIMDNAFNLMAASPRAEEIYRKISDNENFFRLIGSLNPRSIQQQLQNRQSLRHYSEALNQYCFIGDCSVDGQKVAKVTCFLNEHSRIEPAEFEDYLKVISVALQMDRRDFNTGEAQSHFFNTLLNNPSPEKSFIERNRRLHHITLLPPYQLIMVKGEEENGEKPEKIQLYYQKILERIFKYGLFDTAGSGAVCLIEQKQFRKNRDVLIQSCRQNRLKLLTGLPFLDMGESYYQFHHLLRLSRTIESEETVIPLEKYISRELFRILRSQVEVKSLIHHKVRSLLEYDEKNQTEYFRTAWMLFCRPFSQKETADRLNIHINTLKYRIKQLEEVFALNTADGENGDWLYLSFSLARQTENPGW